MLALQSGGPAVPFIDFLTLMLTNMSAGLCILAFFLVWGLSREDRRPWAAGFAMVGLVATVSGLHMSLTWPITVAGEYNLRFANLAFGEMSVLVGILFLGAGGVLAWRMSMAPIAIYAAIAAAMAVALGIRIEGLGLTAKPALTCGGFVLTAIGGLGAALAATVKMPLGVRIANAVVLLVAAAIWLATAILAYWAHMQSLSGKTGGL
ncbi:MAG: DUF981 family protein [Phycisphaerae bacterium]|jgi:putative membrane protein